MPVFQKGNKWRFKKGHNFGKRFKKGNIPWNKKERFKKICPICGKEFEIIFSRVKTAKFCSRKCYGLSCKGKKLTEERKTKIGLSLKGIERSENTRKRISESRLRKTGGKTSKGQRFKSLTKYKEWRNSNFCRDDWTCQKCKDRGGRLDVHHKFNFAQFPKLRISVENGITLCRSCHSLFHRLYGKKNNTPKQLMEFLKHGK